MIRALGPPAAITTRRWATGAYRFEVLAGAGHWRPERHAEELGRLLLEHLRRWNTRHGPGRAGPLTMNSTVIGSGAAGAAVTVLIGSRGRTA